MTELEKKSKNKKAMSLVATWIVILAVVIAVVAFFMVNFRSTETYMSTSSDGATVGSLSCTAVNPENPFFASSAQNSNHELKITTRGQAKDKISYVYNGEYASNAAAETAGSSLHADYNIYMGENGIYQESLYPTFSVVENRLKVSLYTEFDKINSVTARLFFINADEFHELNDYSVEDMKVLYESKGFLCEMSE